MRLKKGMCWLILLTFLLIPPVRGRASGKVTIPAAMTVIREELFYGDESLEAAVLPEGIKKIEDKAFAGSGLKEINLPSSLTYISETAFADCPLEHVSAERGTYAYSWARSHGYAKEYRALLIGEKTFLRGSGKETVLRNVGDVNHLASMLGRVYGPAGQKYQVTKKTDLGYSQVAAAIRSTFADTMEQDVSLFFIATHGASSGDGDLEMAFTGDPKDEAAVAAFKSRQSLSFNTLASWLTANVKGEVIVLLESCGAGSAIYTDSNGTVAAGTGGTPDSDARDRAFVEEAIQAFSGINGANSTTQVSPNSTGDLRLPKYHVLAAAQHHEDSYGLSNDASDPQNLFTMSLIKGVGTAGNSPADTNPRNSILTLKELYAYIQLCDLEYSRTHGISQHVQCYPEGSGYRMFLLK